MQSLFATTCDMAAVPVPNSVQFPSLVPLITGRKKQLHEALYGAFLDRQRAVRTKEWKLIRTPKESQVQLFNVKRDPWEIHNLAADPKYAATLARLDAKLRDLMREMKDPMPVEQLYASANAHTGASAAVGAGAGPKPVAISVHPYIVFILADDLGYGDVRCLNPDGKIPTPHLDRSRRKE